MNEQVPEEYVELGGPIARLSVAVRVMGDDLDPAEITRRFGIDPKFAARKGDRFQRGPKAGGIRRTGIWTFAIAPEPSTEWELDDLVTSLLARLPSDPELWAELSHRFKLDVFCGLFMGTDNQGTELRPETLRALAERGLVLSLDIYGPPGGEAAT